MRILCIYRYYWPDTTPYANILKTLLEKWNQDGHSVTVYTGQPGYNDIVWEKLPWQENHNGVAVKRIWLFPEKKRYIFMRIVNFLFFSVWAISHAIVNKKQYDLILVNSFPPVLMGLAARVICRITGIPYVYHCQDLHPESALISGAMRYGLLYRFLLAIDKENCSQASSVIVLSRDMANTLNKRNVSMDNVHILNNFIIEVNPDFSNIPSPLNNKSDDEFHILFAGNLGNFQGLENIIEAAKLLAPENPHIRFIFMGEGLAKKRMVEQAKDLIEKTVFFISYQPLHVAFAAMEKADLGIISLKPDVYKVAFPSKTMMYLAAGCPLLAIIENNSELAGQINARDIGYVCSRSPESIVNAVRTARDEKVTIRRRDAIRRVARELYGLNVILNKWSEILTACSQTRHKANKGDK